METDGFRFANLTSYRDANCLPGALKYGDLPALLALAAPNPLWIAAEDGRVPQIVDSQYQDLEDRRAVYSFAGPSADIGPAIADWLLQ